MKKIQLSVFIAASAIFFTSCKDETQQNAEKKVTVYNQYVDSISNIAEENASENWDAIDSRYNQIKDEADLAVTTATDKDKIQSDLDEATTKYNDFKAKVVAKKQDAKDTYNKSLFGDSYVSDDMQFMWVNKDNIHSVYQNFVHTVENNKDKYSREEWDQIKIAYEALDSRKNTVEKEGLSAEDNRKIAGLKIKFAPMYTVNRMGAKSEENAAAKQ
ncbi:hypothetical protein [Flavobacterium algicola]|uniref:hypothetical protein n=1 Tax=Flavobacterium algicola TaxID=556529 RepID=UPI001EFE00C7|nr:hypothetical protein [Flavobacterium algicola]MCG9790967.1 hypothetical protein [Flavobacterium algicola]